jgi:imidazolonepropionase
MQATSVTTADLVITNIGELATPAVGRGAVHGKEMDNVQRLKDAFIGIAGGQIIALGQLTELKQQITTTDDTIWIDARSKLVTPGLVDCHTHLIFGGNRANEFGMRCQGKTYAEIAATGGGILASMNGTRNATPTQLLEDSRLRLDRILEHGTTTCEIKTGYGLDARTELSLLQTICQLREEHPVTVIPTFMPAHAVPPGVDRQKYVEEIVEEMLPAAARIFDEFFERSARDKSEAVELFVDVFCDKGYFTLADTEAIFRKAKTLGMQYKVHSDEFEALGATRFAIEFGAASADHLLRVSKDDILAFANSDTIPVLLPGTSFFLNLEEHAPARDLIQSGAAVALSSDFNPGSCHIFSLPFIWGLACIHLKMTPSEALTALTINSACALKCGDTVGRLAPGYRADITIYDVSCLEEVPYNIGWNPVSITIKAGKVAYGRNQASLR